MLTLIAAVAKNNIIGSNGKIPWDIPEEMELFKNTTMGHALIVGRKTYESIGHVLPGRCMFVLSRAVPLLTKEGLGEVRRDTVPPLTPPSKGGEITFCTSVQNALNKTSSKQTAFVIGGASVYAQMMRFVDEMRISHLNKAYEGDAWFLEIDFNIWKIASKKEFPDFIHITYKRT